MIFIRKIFKRSMSLGQFGLLNFILFFILLAISFFDDRTLNGVNVWMKPMKFAVSIGIFSWTMAWYLFYLPQIRKVQKIKLTIITAMIIEMVIIIYQASRGELSHFNVSSVGNAVLFQIMGIAILINTIMVFWAYRLFSVVESLFAGYKRGIRLGMLIFIVASMEGYLMAANLSHTVGAPDGQEGIFFLNWAKAYGDLRIFHFFGIHALQTVPLFAWYFARKDVKKVNIFAVIYFIFSLGTFWYAMAGRGIFWG
ncbi:hypothetical protein [Aquiflexum gelatinilyticum]|uniref:hypothetical protein n=1 Tax=Aquiflexum gelatinilyticum TaxID=2961943 RepID=UPI002167A28D|nr:hypothetical protein [Aquiflexum gelatinilyticum]MCS4435496.1 hypothetical protein [Aquiflexum gelatinilyticum]